ncbi:DUF805 domain-containing protein [Shimia thalassica]|uniref:DUF805 domain-containing protein n=1 Tax=Shimia thalassica TaxID=1715693 RepID=UPI0026E12470|nr:DUF805 domain-containing protein [Shimia thalassica]MDO6521609.1 DUF805 domain-containing protein [Shimia thalassica]
MFENFKQTFQEGFVFQGRSSRSQFWKFVLFTFLVSIVLLIVNSVVFGPTITTQFNVKINSAGEQTESLTQLKQYSSGWLGIIFGVVILIPGVAVAWRRMQDAGWPGYMTFLPIAGAAIAFALFFATSHTVPIDTASVPQGIEVPATMRLPNSALTFFVAWLTAAASLIATIVLLARRSQPGPNKYGPNPHEVPS